jgi:hypothetical protein
VKRKWKRGKREAPERPEGRPEHDAPSVAFVGPGERDQRDPSQPLAGRWYAPPGIVRKFRWPGE